MCGQRESLQILDLLLYFPSSYSWNKSKLNVSGAWWLLNRGDNNWRTLFGVAKRCLWPLSMGLSSHCFLKIFWDFDHWLFNSGWPLNGGSTVTQNSNDCWYNFYIFPVALHYGSPYPRLVSLCVKNVFTHSLTWSPEGGQPLDLSTASYQPSVQQSHLLRMPQYPS